MGADESFCGQLQSIDDDVVAYAGADENGR